MVSWSARHEYYFAEFKPVATSWYPLPLGGLVILSEPNARYTVRAINTAGKPLNPILAGPFTTLEAAQAAYLIMWG